MMSQRVVSYSYMDRELVIELTSVDSLRPHEMIIEELGRRITQSIKEDGILMDPIIADTKLGLIIDGTHRWSALRNLGIDYIPVIPLDYLSEGVKVYRWIRVYEGVGEKEFLNVGNELRREYGDRLEVDKIEEMDLRHEAPIELMYSDGEEWLVYRYNKQLDIISLLDLLKGFEEKISTILNRQPSYIDEKNIGKMFKEGLKGVLVLSYRVICKREIIDIFKKNLYLPPKTTRHVIPYRLIGINMPVDYLINTNLDKALKFLSGLKIEYLGSNIFVGERFYEEDVYKAIHSGQG